MPSYPPLNIYDPSSHIILISITLEWNGFLFILSSEGSFGFVFVASVEDNEIFNNKKHNP